MDRNLPVVIGAGVLTALIVPYVNALLENAAGFSPFGIAVVLFVPIGAIICGFLAVSGFYLMARRQGLERPMPALFVTMLAVQVLSLVLFYWFSYRGAFIPEHDFAPYMTFGEFFEASTFGMTVSSSRYGGTGEVGSAGIVLVFTRTVGFVLAGVVAYKQLPGSGSFLDD